MSKLRKQEALDYHASGRPGKIEVIPTKPYSSQRDLSLAYSPGVAEPCLAIEANPADVYKYTSKGNLVAVISNGTAVLGLGNIGAAASKPVMEGKGLLFKVFADIDVFDIEVDATDVDKFIETVKAISPTFGGINLEDIKAPEAFEIERRLKEELNIPIMHDDQHGTAIISSSALINALGLAKKKIEKVKIVVSGAGAAAISCVKLYVALGAKLENIVMFDSKGAITIDRTDLDEQKQQFASKRKVKDLADALKKADVFLGLSKGNIMSKEMLLSMARNPIVFALANPEPEIPYKVAINTREDVIMATGRSDHPNQVNNVLGFPYIFRGALDVRATSINEEMKLAAVYALAELAKEIVPEEVNEAYGERNISFGRDNIIPKPVDPRLISKVSSAVAKAAIESGVAQETIDDWDAYEEELNMRLGLENKMVRSLVEKAQRRPKRVVFAEAEKYNVLKAAYIAKEDGMATPILLGRVDVVKQMMEEYAIEMDDVEIIDPRAREEKERREEFGKLLFEKRQRQGMTEHFATKLMGDRNYFGSMLVETGEADAMLSGTTQKYSDVIKPALKVIGKRDDVMGVAGMYVLLTKNGPLFLADTTMHANPTCEEIVDITQSVAKTVRKMGITPRIAMLSYSNFGSGKGEDAEKMKRATAKLHETNPNLIVDGEIQANFALNNELLKANFPFSQLLNKKVNTLIFPNLSAGNIAYKLLMEMTDADAIGPVLIGMKKSMHVLNLGSSVREIVNMVAVAVLDAQSNK